MLVWRTKEENNGNLSHLRSDDDVLPLRNLILGSRDITKNYIICQSEPDYSKKWFFCDGDVIKLSLYYVRGSCVIRTRSYTTVLAGLLRLAVWRQTQQVSSLRRGLESYQCIANILSFSTNDLVPPKTYLSTNKNKKDYVVRINANQAFLFYWTINRIESPSNFQQF